MQGDMKTGKQQRRQGGGGVRQLLLSESRVGHARGKGREGGREGRQTGWGRRGEGRGQAHLEDVPENLVDDVLENVAKNALDEVRELVLGAGAGGWVRAAKRRRQRKRRREGRSRRNEPLTFRMTLMMPGRMSARMPSSCPFNTSTRMFDVKLSARLEGSSMPWLGEIWSSRLTCTWGGSRPINEFCGPPTIVTPRPFFRFMRGKSFSMAPNPTRERLPALPPSIPPSVRYEQMPQPLRTRMRRPSLVRTSFASAGFALSGTLFCVGRATRSYSVASGCPPRARTRFVLKGNKWKEGGEEGGRNG